jgi:hypothetical protein
MKLGVTRRHAAVGVVIGTLTLVAGAQLTSTAGAEDGRQTRHGQWSNDSRVESHRDVSKPLSSITAIRPTSGPPTFKREFTMRAAPFATGAPDTALQSAPGAAAAPTIESSFDGVGNGFAGPAGTYAVNSAPPDANGAVGRNHYVQIVNTAFAIFNKSGTVVYGPAATNTLWSGFGGGCESNNDGDATVVYDRQADRFIISQFSVSTTPYLQCVAVSATSDPTGAYYRYSFQYANFPDYPKLGVWPDAYYETFNLFNANGTSFLGPEVCAYDRAQMLIGATATQQCFTLSPTFGGLLPSNVDSASPPPAGSPNYILDFATNALDLWKFHVDWAAPASSTLTLQPSIPVAPFAAACNGGGSCIPQAGTRLRLDSLANRLMYRLAYRNFGDHESLVVTHSVNAGTSVGVRWYEIRNPRTTPTVYQQGTYAPDARYRWMSSVAQDGAGNIGLGFSTSSTSTHPGVHFTGHLTSDPLGVMGQGEGVLIDGAGSQTEGLGRWGDYASLTVDPVDDCTFWFTSEYIPAVGSFNWRTRIGTFKLSGCNQPDFTVSGSPASRTVSPGNSASYDIAIAPTGGFAGSVSLAATGLPAGATATFTPNPATGSSTMTIATGAATPTGTSVVTIAGTAGSQTRSATVTLVVSQPDFSLAASPASQTVSQGASTTYNVTVTPVAGFNLPVSLDATGLPSGAAAAFNPNPAGGSSTLSITTTSTTPSGTYSLTIKGTAGSLVHTTSVTLVVSGGTPDFTLSATPASLSIIRGATAFYTITVAGLNGFAGTVSLTLSGGPPRTPTSFSPNPTSSSSTLSIPTRGPGSYTLTITGTSGAKTHSVNVTLVVS